MAQTLVLLSDGNNDCHGTVIDEIVLGLTDGVYVDLEANLGKDGEAQGDTFAGSIDYGSGFPALNQGLVACSRQSAKRSCLR